MTSDEISNLVKLWRQNKKFQTKLVNEMRKAAMEQLGMSEEEVTARRGDVVFLLEGYLIGKGLHKKLEDIS